MKTSKKTASRYKCIISIIFSISAALMILMLIVNSIVVHGSGSYFGVDGYSSLNDEWITYDGESFESQNIDEYINENSDSLSIFYELPAKMIEDQTLSFRSKNCYVSVLIDGQQIYETLDSEAPFYNKSPGTRWNFIQISNRSSGKVIQLRITRAYSDGRAKVDNFSFGDRAAIVLQIVYSKIFAVIVSVLIGFAGLIFAAFSLILNHGGRTKEHSLMWLVLFAFIAAIWSLIETNVLQLFVANMRLVQVVDNMMLVLGPLPLYMFLECNFGIFKSRIIRILCAIDVAYVFAATISQIFGWFDYHQTLNGSIVNYGIIIILFAINTFKPNKKALSHPDAVEKTRTITQKFACIVLSLGLLGDLTRYLLTDVMDRAVFIRIGLLGFIVFTGAGSTFHMIQLVRKGAQAEFISRLAYSDGLTLAGNRTAYNEAIQMFIDDPPKEQLCIAMFDINNLKSVNDLYGHHAGDELILCSSDIISSAFSPFGKLYRIGGDEFMLLMCDRDVKKRFEQCYESFISLIENENSGENHPYTVSIACGMSVCKNFSADEIHAAEARADTSMYENKAMLKHSILSKSEKA